MKFHTLDLYMHLEHIFETPSTHAYNGQRKRELESDVGWWQGWQWTAEFISKYGMAERV